MVSVVADVVLVDLMCDTLLDSPPAVIIFWPGFDGPTGPDSIERAGGSSLKSLYSSRILTDKRNRELIEIWSVFHSFGVTDTHIWSSSRSSNSVPANTAAVRLTPAFIIGANEGRPAESIVSVVEVVAILEVWMWT